VYKFDFQNSLITKIIRNVTDINNINNNLRNQRQPSIMPLPEGSTHMYKDSARSLKNWHELEPWIRPLGMDQPLRTS
jgi:hypothetical protein